MTKKRLLILVCLGMLLTNISAQFIPDPDLALRPYFVGDNKSIHLIEKEDVELDAKSKSNIEMYYLTNTPKAEARFTRDNLPQLVVRIEKKIELADVFILLPGEVKKGRRRFTQNMNGLANENHKVTINMLRDGLYEIILPKGLPAGEYAFMPINGGGNNAFTSYGGKPKIVCFGID